MRNVCRHCFLLRRIHRRHVPTAIRNISEGPRSSTETLQLQRDHCCKAPVRKNSSLFNAAIEGMWRSNQSSLRKRNIPRQCWLLCPGCPSDENRLAGCCPPTLFFNLTQSQNLHQPSCPYHYNYHLSLFCKTSHLRTNPTILTPFLYRKSVVFATFHPLSLEQSRWFCDQSILHHSTPPNIFFPRWLPPLRPTRRSGSRPSCLRPLRTLVLHEQNGTMYEISMV